MRPAAVKIEKSMPDMRIADQLDPAPLRSRTGGKPTYSLKRHKLVLFSVQDQGRRHTQRYVSRIGQRYPIHCPVC